MRICILHRPKLHILLFIENFRVKPTHWRKAQMRQHTTFGAKRYCSVSPTKLRPTLLVHRSRKSAQLLRCTLCAVRQQVGHKSTGAKAAQNMLVKLTPGHTIKSVSESAVDFKPETFMLLSQNWSKISLVLDDCYIVHGQNW